MKNEYIKIRLSEEEKNNLKELARQHGLTVSSYIRYLIMREKALYKTRYKEK